MTAFHESSPSEDVTLDRMFTSLSDPTRRHILTTLVDYAPHDSDEFAPLELEPADEPLGQFRAELYHNHLPRLDRAGFVEWDRRSDTVARGPNFEEIEPLVGLMDDHRDELPAGWP